MSKKIGNKVTEYLKVNQVSRNAAMTLIHPNDRMKKVANPLARQILVIPIRRMIDISADAATVAIFVGKTKKEYRNKGISVAGPIFMKTRLENCPGSFHNTSKIVFDCPKNIGVSKYQSLRYRTEGSYNL